MSNKNVLKLCLWCYVCVHVMSLKYLYDIMCSCRATPFRASNQWLTDWWAKSSFTSAATPSCRPASRSSGTLSAASSSGLRSPDLKWLTWSLDFTPTSHCRALIWERCTTTRDWSTWVNMFTPILTFNMAGGTFDLSYFDKSF